MMNVRIGRWPVAQIKPTQRDVLAALADKVAKRIKVAIPNGFLNLRLNEYCSHDLFSNGVYAIKPPVSAPQSMHVMYACRAAHA
jgi:hypothetical protein